MKKAARYILFISLLSSGSLFSQNNSCANKLDSAAVIKIAKKRRAWWTSENSRTSVRFDDKTCTWTAKSSRSKHTNRGDCKHTNGCTLIRSVTLTMDASTGKIKSKTKEKKLYPNYE